MPRPITADDLWALPRVGAPVPSPDGSRFIVPVTTYSMKDNKGTTRLWLVPAAARRAGRGGKRDPARPLTDASASSTSPAWSPDGQRIAFVRKPGGGAHASGGQLCVMRMDGGEARRVTDLRFDVVDPQWLPDGVRVAFLASAHLDAPDPAATAAIVAEQEKAIRPSARVTEERFYRYWDRWLTDRRRQHVHLADVERGDVVNLTPSFTGWFDPIEPAGHVAIAPDGREIAFSAMRPRDPVTSGVFTVAVPPPRGPGGSRRAARLRDLTPRGWTNAQRPRYSPDGRHLLFGVHKHPLRWSDRMRLALLDRRTGRCAVADDWDRSPDEWAFSPRGDRVICAVETEGRTAIVTIARSGLARGTARAQRRIARGGTFSGVQVAGTRVFANVSSLRAPGEIVSYALSGAGRRANTAFTAPVMSAIEMGRVEEHAIRGADGAAVQMLLVHPPASAGRGRRAGAPRRAAPRPLLHLVHGGPHAAFGDTWHWRWNAQVFAGAGHLVAMVNFHGSSGWGQSFADSIVGAWGDKPYRDVSAATDWLVDRGLADPKRMALAGGSYGGYLVSWIASQTARYACIVNHAGVCDLQTQFATDIAQGLATSAGGEPWSDRAGLDRYSPLRHAEGFASPMLVIHGERDYRVPMDQALEIYAVHKARGIPARLVIYPDENHWILTPQNSRHWYGEVLGWIARWTRSKRAR
jgi:dipeptidyl aminopeptidase/acylaminoacyl peptidase